MVCGKEVSFTPSIPSLLLWGRRPAGWHTVPLGIRVKGGGGSSWCGWRGASSLLPSSRLLSRGAPTPFSHLLLEIIPCVLSVCLGEEEEEEKGQAARGDQW